MKKGKRTCGSGYLLRTIYHMTCQSDTTGTECIRRKHNKRSDHQPWYMVVTISLQGSGVGKVIAIVYLPLHS